MRFLIFCLMFLVSGCSLQDTNDARKMRVGEKDYYFASGSVHASCQEMLTAYLFTADSTPVHATQHGGPNLLCSAMQGAAAGAAVGWGLSESGSSIGQNQSQGQGQGQQQQIVKPSACVPRDGAPC